MEEVVTHFNARCFFKQRVWKCDVEWTYGTVSILRFRKEVKKLLLKAHALEMSPPSVTLSEDQEERRSQITAPRCQTVIYS